MPPKPRFHLWWSRVPILLSQLRRCILALAIISTLCLANAVRRHSWVGRLRFMRFARGFRVEDAFGLCKLRFCPVVIWALPQPYQVSEAARRRGKSQLLSNAWTRREAACISECFSKASDGRQEHEARPQTSTNPTNPYRGWRCYYLRLQIHRLPWNMS